MKKRRWMASLVFSQDLSNKDMKRDLYIVSQVIRTGECPVSFCLFLDFLYLEPNVPKLPQGSAFLPAIATNATSSFSQRTVSKWKWRWTAILTSFVRIPETSVIFTYHHDEEWKCLKFVWISWISRVVNVIRFLSISNHESIEWYIGIKKKWRPCMALFYSNILLYWHVLKINV